MMRNINQFGKLCTYNVTLRQVRVNIVAVEEKYVLHILSVCLWRSLSRTQSAFSMCYLWRVCLSTVFFHVASKTARFT
jgi:hypothetical protein